MNGGRRKLRYKGMSVNLLGLPGFSDFKKEKEIIKRKYLQSFISNFPENTPKNLLLIYDVPHTMKKERDWFRRQLKNFGFNMIQKSVWMGPSPIPKDFLDYLRRIGLEKKFKTFKLEKSYIKKS